ncbi:MAG: MBL fold metallo-hydrolase [Rikenellaceae bacterium]|nr:MBL fold metallo-hydrolase [Rikenellaceae bacterium]MCL2692475.1 MBL fold metallo-hydrolase [Rikenellaceae bacterium]
MTTLTFLGTGTSQGVPIVTCDCAVCRSADPRDRRLRTSAMIERGSTRVIIDAGPDFRQQMLREEVRRIDGIVLTHEHKDHIAGLDDVRAYNYTARAPMDVYATERVQHVVCKDFDYAFAEGRPKGVPEMNLVTISSDKPFRVRDIEFIPIVGQHGRLPVLGFRMDGIAYLTDFNRIEAAEIEKLRGVEVLIINALCREPHTSHFSLDEALRVRELVCPERTYITHLSHRIGPYAEITSELPAGCFFAYDGLRVEA